MLRSALSSTQALAPFRDPALRPEIEFVDLGRLLAACRRQTKPVLIGIVAGLVLAVVYLIVAPRLYTADTQILINQDQSKAFNTDPQLSADAMQSDETVLSQVTLIGSTRIALQVVDALDLTKNESFMAPKASLLSLVTAPIRWVAGHLRGSSAAPTTDPRRTAAETLLDNLSVQRTGRTFALDLAYTSNDAALAAKITNAFADAYLNDGLEANFDATQRRGTWLENRLTELQQNLQEADLAVQKYRTDHGLIAADGKLVSEQQLSELNSQLILAQADTARARARAEQFDGLLKSDSPDALQNAAVATGAADDSATGKLRAQFLESSTRLDALVKRWGESHPEVAALKKEVDDEQGQLRAELDRIANSYHNDLSVAETRETSLRSSLSQILDATASNNKTQVELRSLQQKADSYRDLVQNFLQRQQQATQEKSFPVQSARVISDADVPIFPSSPRKALMMAVGLILGFVGGAGFGAVREFRDRFFRTADQVRSELGIEFLGLIPSVNAKGTDDPGPDEADNSSRRSSHARRWQAMNYVVDEPLSAFAEAMRRIKIAADITHIDSGPKVIGVTSVLPREGKSTVSANLARLIASQGARTLLIDADLRGLGLTRVMASEVKTGLLEVLLDNLSLATVARKDPKTKMVFLPSVARRDVSHTADVLASTAMGNFLVEAGASFDYIILDLPPLAPVADASACARHLDAVVMVIEWGGTGRNIVRSTLASEPELASKMVGAVLNKVDVDKMKLYSDFGSNEYYYGRYSSYYTQS